METDKEAQPEEKRVFAEEQARLAMLQGFVGLIPGRFKFVTPPAFKDAYPDQREKWPVFKLRQSDGLDFNQELDTESLYHFDEAKQKPVLNRGAFRLARLRACVAGWKNFRDDEGNEVEYRWSAGGLADDCIRAMKPELQTWLLAQLDQLDGISKEESDALKF